MYKIIEKLRGTAKSFTFRNVPRIAKPVFILSAPRSGSTHLYEILRRCKSVVSLDQENDDFWWSLFPYSRLDFPNDYISENELNGQSPEQISAALSFYISRKLYDQCFHRFLKLRFTQEETPYLEKTVSNCFHLEILTRIFPSARYVHLVRDGRATIASMIEGWRSGCFMKRNLPFPDKSSIDYWTFPVPPGWESMAHEKLNKICAWIWLQHNEYVLDFFAANPLLQKNLIRVSYEEMVDDPEKIANSLINFCGFKKSSKLESYIRSNQSSRTTISDPVPMKWKKGNVAEIQEIENFIAPMMERLGYPEERD